MGNDIILQAAIGGGSTGFLLGLIPMVMGLIRDRIVPGTLGMAVSIVLGTIFGAAGAIPAAAIFAIVASGKRNQ